MLILPEAINYLSIPTVKSKPTFTSTNGMAPYIGLIPWLSAAFMLCQFIPLLYFLMPLLLTKTKLDDELYTFPAQYNP